MPSENSELTARERQVIELIATGKTTKEAAHLLGIAYKTVDSHRTSIMRKLGTRNAAEVTRAAIRFGFIDP